MANYAPNTNGSQFYITLDKLSPLDGNYTVFGRVVEGMEVIKKHRADDTMKKVTIIRKGAAASAFLTDQASWQKYYSQATDKAIRIMQEAKDTAVAQIKQRWPELESRPDGFLVKVLKEGSGPTIRRYWLAKVAYKGMLPSGQVFDESSLHGGPLEFEVGSGQVIPGWDRMIMEMKKGEKRLVAIPPEFGYGPDGGAGGLIPRNSYLIFELEVSDYTE